MVGCKLTGIPWGHHGHLCVKHTGKVAEEHEMAKAGELVMNYIQPQKHVYP